jgi:hypothetical protein
LKVPPEGQKDGGSWKDKDGGNIFTWPIVGKGSLEFSSLGNVSSV